MPEPEKTALEALGDWDFHEAGPVASLDEALKHLRRPFAPAAVRWKVQAARKGFGTVIAYIDARLVIERLNLVVGGEWHDKYNARGQGVEECELSLFGGEPRCDVGTAGGIEAAKAMRSDALKRAGVKFGIGVSIYALKAVELRATSEWESEGDRLLIANFSRAGKGPNAKEVWSARMSPAAERWLADTYERWLAARGERLFGPPLDHGDELGAQGMEAQEGARVASPEEAPAEPENGGAAVEDEAMTALLAEVAEVYGEIVAMKPTQIPPGRHTTRVRKEQAAGHDAMRAYRDELLKVRDTMKEARA